MPSLTQTMVNRSAFTKTGQRFVWDGNLGLRIGRRTKAYVVQTRRQGRITLGRHPEILLEHAKQLAAPYLDTERSRSGRQSRLNLGMTLRQAIDHTSKVRGTNTIERANILECHFGPWLDKPVRGITEEDVEGVFEDLMAAGKLHTAVKMKNILATVLRTVRRKCGLGDTIATQFLSDEGRLPALPPRQCSWETDAEFAEVVNAVREYPNASLANMALLQCFTGMRLGEAQSLRWDCIDLDRLTLTVRKTKNGRALILPLCDIHVGILEEQKLLAASLKMDAERSIYVFPAERQGTQVPYIQEVQCLYLHVRKQTSIHIVSSDWRRWFKSVAATIPEIPPDIAPRLTNHVQGQNAHQRYIQGFCEQLRPSMEILVLKLQNLASKQSMQ